MKPINVQDYEFDLTRLRVWECAGNSVIHAQPVLHLREITSLTVTLWFLCEHASQRPGRWI